SPIAHLHLLHSRFSFPSHARAFSYPAVIALRPQLDVRDTTAEARMAAGAGVLIDVPEKARDGPMECFRNGLAAGLACRLPRGHRSSLPQTAQHGPSSIWLTWRFISRRAARAASPAARSSSGDSRTGAEGAKDGRERLTFSRIGRSLSPPRPAR